MNACVLSRLARAWGKSSIRALNVPAPFLCVQGKGAQKKGGDPAAGAGQSDPTAPVPPGSVCCAVVVMDTRGQGPLINLVAC